MVAADIPAIEPIPIDALGGQDPLPSPKRGRGRPPALNPDGTRKNPPRASQGAPRGRTTARKASTRRTPTRAGTRSLAPEITGLLTLINTGLLMSPLGTRPAAASYDPSITPTHVGDELDAAEIAALAAALDAQARRSPRFRKFLEGALTASAGGQLVGIVGIIAARRLARHGVIPAEADFALGMMISGDAIAAAASFVPTPEPTPPPTDETIPNRDADPIDFEAVG